jgi:hypothetical protein
MLDKFDGRNRNAQPSVEIVRSRKSFFQRSICGSIGASFGHPGELDVCDVSDVGKSKKFFLPIHPGVHHSGVHHCSFLCPQSIALKPLDHRLDRLLMLRVLPQTFRSSAWSIPMVFPCHLPPTSTFYHFRAWFFRRLRLFFLREQNSRKRKVHRNSFPISAEFINKSMPHFKERARVNPLHQASPACDW